MIKLTIEKILEKPYWIIDILPKQVPKDSSGQYFAIEDFFLKEQLSEIKKKHINVILKLNCYRDITIDDEKSQKRKTERKMSDEQFFRQADEQEKSYIAENECFLYKRERRSFVILLLLFAGAFIVGLVSFFVPMGIGVALAVVLIAAGVLMSIVTVISLRSKKRQLNKVRRGDYGVQHVVITDVHNEIHGLKSNQYVTFTSGTGAEYRMNTNTSGDQSLFRGRKGLLVIINNEKNVLLTCKYRFFKVLAIRSLSEKKL